MSTILAFAAYRPCPPPKVFVIASHELPLDAADLGIWSWRAKPPTDFFFIKVSCVFVNTVTILTMATAFMGWVLLCTRSWARVVCLISLFPFYRWRHGVPDRSGDLSPGRVAEGRLCWDSSFEDWRPVPHCLLFHAVFCTQTLWLAPLDSLAAFVEMFEECPSLAWWGRMSRRTGTCLALTYFWCASRVPSAWHTAGV